MVVEGVFKITGLGTAVVGQPNLKIGRMKSIETGIRVRLTCPDGTAIESTAYFMFPTPCNHLTSLCFKELTKEDIPIGTIIEVK